MTIDSPTVPPGCRELRAVLPHPPGINRTYRSGQGRWYKTAPATDWAQSALLVLRRVGFRTVPAGVYWVAVNCGLFTRRLDADAPVKLLIDTVAYALGIDDATVGMLAVTKVRVTSLADQRLEIGVLVRPCADAGEWDALSRSIHADVTRLEAPA